jgi:uncharacterized protein (DUF2252 family)
MLRRNVPRAEHRTWKVAEAHRDPIDILEKSSGGRLPELVPIRYARMAHSPFAFLRGAAAVMAYDLAGTPVTGLQTQLCGDCHLLNFGLFGTPERQLVFDLNDFDETHPGPWEWDLKRLAASFAVAVRDNHASDDAASDVVAECARSYRRRMREYAGMSPLETWYAKLEWETLIASARGSEAKKFGRQLALQARRRIAEHLFPKIANADGGRHRLIDQPPVLFHVAEQDAGERVLDAISQYRLTLPEDRRVLLDRYELEDFAFKVVGVGSVGTRCFIALMISGDADPLLLQFKESGRSVLEPYTRQSGYDHQGQRIVMGQRLMQSSSDIFLGWARGQQGNEFYVRQLRDMKLSIPLEQLNVRGMKRYARLCGWTLARAHAKAGDAAAISGYLGRSDRFDRALAAFAVAYADQTVRDHAALVQAIRSGRVDALSEE